MNERSTRLGPSYYADCAIFSEVAVTLSYRAAGEALGISRSTVSKRITALEQVLGVVLLNRSTRSISLTEAGHTLLAHWRSVEHAGITAYQAVHGSDLEPSGSLRVSLASSLAAVLMPSLMNEFLRDWPEVRLNLHFGECFVDVVGKGYDTVIRVAERLTDSALTAKRLATSRRVLAASPGYLEKYGRPDRLSSLKKHRTLGTGRTAERGMTWRFAKDGKAQEVLLTPVFAANNDLALVLAACLGVGVIYIPRILIESELHRGRLKVIELNDAEGPELGVFGMYPHREPPEKVRVFVDFVGKQLGSMDHLDRWSPLQA